MENKGRKVRLQIRKGRRGEKNAYRKRKPPRIKGMNERKRRR